MLGGGGGIKNSDMRDNFNEKDEQRDEKDEPRDNLAAEADEMTELDESFDAPVDEEALQDEAAEWRDKYTRLVAEFENYRKRTMREKLELINAGGEDVVRSMLEVLDDMDRALAALETATDMEAVRQGIGLIDTKLRGALKARGLAEIEAVGHELDTDLHEAVARVEAAEEAQKGRITDVVQKGYTLRDKILRYAKVVVGQ